VRQPDLIAGAGFATASGAGRQAMESGQSREYAGTQMNESSLFCERCGAGLEPGKAEFYVVRIEAFADPTPPSITAEDLHRDIPAEIERLLASMRDLSEQAAMDQVYRKMILYLCNGCYQRWIERPVG
jgi:hypothetical protein